MVSRNINLARKSKKFNMLDLSELEKVDNSILEEYKSVAIAKQMDPPNDEGYVHHTFHGSFKSMAKSIEELYPTDEELGLIQVLGGLLPPVRENYLMIRDANPIGNKDDVDWQGDQLSSEAEGNLKDGGFNTPLLQDHKHTIEGIPPVGMCVKSYIGSEGLRETYAVYRADYNKDIIDGLIGGMLNKLSIGTLIRPENKICNSCLKNNSTKRTIYSIKCSHKPLMKDENGEYTSFMVSKIDRYLERSLVNVPARMGTSLKSLDLEAFNKMKLPNLDASQEEYFDALAKIVEEWKPSPKALDLANGFIKKVASLLLKEKIEMTKEELTKALTDAVGEILKSSDKIEGVKTIEGSTSVSDKSANDASLINGTDRGNQFNDGSAKVDVSGGSKPNDATLKDVCPTPHSEGDPQRNQALPSTGVPVEAKAGEKPIPDSVRDDDINKDQAVKPDKDKVKPKEEEMESCMKDKAQSPDPVPGFSPTIKPQGELATIEVSPKMLAQKMLEMDKMFSDQTVPLVKLLTDQTDKFNKVLEVVAEQGKALTQLQESQLKLQEAVAKGMAINSNETVQKFVDVANQTIKAIQDESPIAVNKDKPTAYSAKALNDFVDVFVKKGSK